MRWIILFIVLTCLPLASASETNITALEETYKDYDRTGLLQVIAESNQSNHLLERQILDLQEKEQRNDYMMSIGRRIWFFAAKATGSSDEAVIKEKISEYLDKINPDRVSPLARMKKEVGRIFALLLMWQTWFLMALPFTWLAIKYRKRIKQLPTELMHYREQSQDLQKEKVTLDQYAKKLEDQNVKMARRSGWDTIYDNVEKVVLPGRRTMPGTNNVMTMNIQTLEAREYTPDTFITGDTKTITQKLGWRPLVVIEHQLAIARYLEYPLMDSEIYTKLEQAYKNILKEVSQASIDPEEDEGIEG